MNFGCPAEVFQFSHHWQYLFVVGYFKMTRYILLSVGLLFYFTSFSQKCDGNTLQADKALLQKFWTTFKQAVNNKDKAKLASLCRFPFNCDYCILDSTKQNVEPPIKVTKASFYKSQYKIFFTNRLIREVYKHDIPQDLYIFQPYYNTVDKQCTYNFNYIAVDENRRYPGMQRFFDIEKINGQFKIISTWTVP